MAVQFNLLPSVKLEYIRTRRLKRTVIGISLVTTGVALAVFIGLFVIVNVLQPRHISNLTNDINDGVAKIKAVEDIDKVLTVQNQLSQLTSLHEEKPAASRALSYLGKITPQKAKISETSFDFEKDEISIVGTADSLATVNKFADTLKFTTFKADDVDGEPNAFSEVVLSNFSVSNEQVTYQLEFKFAPEIFDNTKKVQLKIPDIISTRSQTESPTDLFGNTAGDE